VKDLQPPQEHWYAVFSCIADLVPGQCSSCVTLTCQVTLVPSPKHNTVKIYKVLGGL
jgi:hypothetical protein